MLIGKYQPVACGAITTKNGEINQKLHSGVCIISIQNLLFKHHTACIAMCSSLTIMVFFLRGDENC